MLSVCPYQKKNMFSGGKNLEIIVECNKFFIIYYLLFILVGRKYTVETEILIFSNFNI